MKKIKSKISYSIKKEIITGTIASITLLYTPGYI
jgi:hypothetical protein